MFIAGYIIACLILIPTLLMVFFIIKSRKHLLIEFNNHQIEIFTMAFSSLLCVDGVDVNKQKHKSLKYHTEI